MKNSNLLQAIKKNSRKGAGLLTKISLAKYLILFKLIIQLDPI